MKSGIAKLAQFGLVVLAALLVTACGDSKKGGGGNNTAQCLQGQYCPPGGGYQTSNILRSDEIYVSNRQAYRSLLGGLLGCGNCDGVDNQFRISLSLNSLSTPQPSQGLVELTILYDGGYPGNYQTFTVRTFTSPLFPRVDGTIVQTNGVPGGNFEAIFSITDANAQYVNVELRRNGVTFGSGLVYRNSFGGNQGGYPYNNFPY